jgi:protein-S-isoprenylcysteine O-methyltransferase Ste14
LGTLRRTILGSTRGMVGGVTVQPLADFVAAMTEPRTVEEVNDILLFNSAFLGTLAWLASAAVVSRSDGWWYERGQIVLVVAGVVLFWIAWWLDEQRRTRQALKAAGPAVAILSIWVTSVHAVLF